MTTFADLMGRRLRDGAEQPLVTWYDHDSGERVELSVTTYANWVAKVASLLAEEYDAERGGTLRVDLPTHWLGPVFLGAAWTLGLVVTEDEEPDMVVCGPAGLHRWAPEAARIPVLACSLLPMGVRFAGPLPVGVHDVGVEVWSQPDAFTPWDPPTGGDRATDELTQDTMWSRAAVGASLPDGGRLLSTANPASPSGLTAFSESLARSGSVVLVSHPDALRLEDLSATERCTARFVAPD